MGDPRVKVVPLSTLAAQTCRVLRYEISMFHFYHWFMSHTWGVHLWKDIPAKKFAEALDLLFSEYTGKFISEEQLREEMERLVANRGPQSRPATQPPPDPG